MITTGANPVSAMKKIEAAAAIANGGEGIDEESRIADVSENIVTLEDTEEMSDYLAPSVADIALEASRERIENVRNMVAEQGRRIQRVESDA